MDVQMVARDEYSLLWSHIACEWMRPGTSMVGDMARSSPPLPD